MARRPPTWSEALVGRRCPPDATYLDILMAGFLREDGTPVARAEPSDAWMRPAHRQARKEGWIRLQERWSLMGGKAFGVYAATETGLIAARAASDRVAAARQARRAWALDLQAKLKEPHSPGE